MPDVKVRYPRNSLKGSALEHSIDFADELKHIIKTALTCEDYRGQPVILSKGEIDVHLMPYGPDQMHTTGAQFLIEITGYDFPSRMANIQERLVGIQGGITDYLRNVIRYQQDGESKIVAVTFIPISDGCYV